MGHETNLRKLLNKKTHINMKRMSSVGIAGLFHRYSIGIPLVFNRYPISISLVFHWYFTGVP